MSSLSFCQARAVKCGTVLKAALVCLLCALAVAALLVVFWLKGVFLPSWVSWNETVYAADLDGDGEAEVVELSDKALKVYEGSLSSEAACESDSGWLVSDVLSGDIDSDGATEVVLLCWKRGRYGTDKPFWVLGDEAGYSQHIFIFRYNGKDLEPVWMASDILVDAAGIKLDENMCLKITDKGGEISYWAWSSWGLSRLEDEEMRALEESGKNLSFLAVGDNIAHDVMLLQCLDDEDEGAGYDFSGVYEGVEERVESFDMASVVQETVFTFDDTQAAGYPRFLTPASMGDALVDAGFDVVAGATNHSGDGGVQAIEDTCAYWEGRQGEVTLLGLRDSQDEPLVKYVERGGIKLALCDFTAGLSEPLEEGESWRVSSNPDLEQITGELEQAESDADISICYVHAGREGDATPTDEQLQLSETLVSAGADIVIFTHSHVVQTVQTVHATDGSSGIVFFGLGNFASNQNEVEENLGAAAELVISLSEDKAYVFDWKLVPLVCHQEADSTKVYFLDDYSDSLAEKHRLHEDGFDLINLENLFLEEVLS